MNLTTHLPRLFLAGLALAGTLAPLSAAPPSLVAGAGGRTGSIKGLVTWPQAGETNASRTFGVYLVQVRASTQPGTFGTTTYKLMQAPTTVVPGPVGTRRGIWFQTYEVQNAPTGVPLAVLINVRKGPDGQPSSDYDRTSDPQFATCNAPDKLNVTRFDYRKRGTPH